MITKMTCEVKNTTDCKPVVSTKCGTVQYQECTEEPQETCEEVEMRIPKQEKELKRKCLLPDDGAQVALPLPTPRGSKALGRENLGAIVAAAKAQALPWLMKTEVWNYFCICIHTVSKFYICILTWLCSC